MKREKLLSVLILVVLLNCSIATLPLGGATFFGHTEVGESYETFNIVHNLRGSSYVAPENGTVTAITAELAATVAGDGATFQVKAALYDSNYNLLGYSDEQLEHFFNERKWVTFPFAVEAPIVEGRNYILAVWGQHYVSTIYVVGDTNSSTVHYSYSSFYTPSGFPEYAPFLTSFADMNIVANYTSAPVSSDLSVSSRAANSTCVFEATFSDETELAPYGQYQFGTNNTGVWVWEDPVNFTSNPQVVSVSKVLTDVADDVVSYQWNFTDNAGHFNTTGVLSFVVITSEIRLALPFDDEPSGVAVDHGGYENHGVIVGAERSYDGYFGMSLAFSGDDYVTVIDDYSLDLTSQIYLSVYIKPTSIVESVIFDKPNTYGLYLTGGGGLAMMVNGFFFNTSAGVVSNGVWQHVVGVYDGETVEIYVNNVLRKSESYSSVVVPSAFDVVIGYEFIGYIDEVTLYSALLPFGVPIADYPYVYNCLVNVDADSWVVTQNNYNFTNIYIRQDSSAPLSYVKFNFTDGQSQLGLDYTVASNSYTTYVGAEENTTKVTFLHRNYATVGNAGFLYATIKIEEAIRSVTNVNVTLFCIDSLGREGSLFIPNRFGIYGVGGSVEYELSGDGAPVLGGTNFDVMATDSSIGSYAKAKVLDANFQHISMLVQVYHSTYWDGSQWVEPSTEHNTAWVGFGVDYLIDNSTWAEGWYVNITMPDGKADAENGWVRLNCSWYNSGNYVKSDTIYAMYEAHTANDVTTQFSLYVDLWISNNAGSSQICGHVSSVYYGMTKTGWWLWSNWGPVHGLATSSYFMDNLYDLEGEIIGASKLSVFRMWSQVAKIASGTGASDSCTWAIILKSLQIKTLAYAPTLVGINTPIFQPTTTPDMPVGFFASLGNVLNQALDSISNGIAMITTGGAAITAAVLDSAANFFGVNDFSASISSFLGAIGSYFANSVAYIVGLITSFFTLFSNTVMFIVTWFGYVIDMFVRISTIVVDILSGAGDVATGFGNIFESFNIGELVVSGFIPLILIVAWFQSIDDRARRLGGGWMSYFMSDIQSMISVFSFIIDLSWRIFGTVIDYTMRFLNVFI